MRDYGKLYITWWTSPETRDFSDDAKLLGAYLQTGPHTTALGCFRLPDGYVAEDLNWPLERVSKGFVELFRKGYANRCETTNWVLISDFLKLNPPENPNQIKNLRRLAAQVPESATIYEQLKQTIEKHLGPDIQLEMFAAGQPFENRSQRVPPTVSEPFRNQEQEQEQEQEPEQDQEQEQEIDGVGSGGSAAAADAEPAPAVFELGPFKGSEVFQVTQKHLDRWRSLYPGVDVMQGLRNMTGWLDANPSKRKTRAGALSFINTWLQKDQERIAAERIPPAPTNGKKGHAPVVPFKRDYTAGVRDGGRL